MSSETCWWPAFGLVCPPLAGTPTSRIRVSIYTRVLALTLNSSFLLICKTSLTGKVVGLLPPMQEIEFDFLSPSSGCGCSAQLRPAPPSSSLCRHLRNEQMEGIYTISFSSISQVNKQLFPNHITDNY